jgi:hypothetical protein
LSLVSQLFISDKQLVNLSEEKNTTDGAHFKLKDENSVLMDRYINTYIKINLWMRVL